MRIQMRTQMRTQMRIRSPLSTDRRRRGGGVQASDLREDLRPAHQAGSDPHMLKAAASCVEGCDPYVLKAATLTCWMPAASYAEGCDPYVLDSCRPTTVQASAGELRKASTLFAAPPASGRTRGRSTTGANPDAISAPGSRRGARTLAHTRSTHTHTCDTHMRHAYATRVCTRGTHTHMCLCMRMHMTTRPDALPTISRRPPNTLPTTSQQSPDDLPAGSRHPRLTARVTDVTETHRAVVGKPGLCGSTCRRRSLTLPPPLST